MISMMYQGQSHGGQVAQSVTAGAHSLSGRVVELEGKLESLRVGTRDLCYTPLQDVGQRVDELERRVEELAEAVPPMEQLAARLDALQREIHALKQRLDLHLADHRAPRAKVEQTLEEMECKVDFIERLEVALSRLSPEDREDLKQEALQRFNGQNGRNGGGYLDFPGRPKG